ncbi:MAG: hypothetical protein U0525_05445 [Patescibacteria group bacterium]
MKHLHLIIPIVLFVLMAFLGIYLYESISQDQYNIEKEKLELQKVNSESRKKLEKVDKISKFLRKHSSPLYPYASHIVDEAEKNGIDYRLIPAIAMNESTLCKAIPQNSYNCWGWGIYGDKITRFTSYNDAITVISKGLKKNYYDRGMASPSAIMTAYTPSSPDGIWAKKIHKWYAEIDPSN